MAFSFSRLILSDSNIETCIQAFALLDSYECIGQRHGTAAYAGEIDGQSVWLGFSRIGRPVWKCSCGKSGICKHAIAGALAWDKSRNVSDPTEEDLQYFFKL